MKRMHVTITRTDEYIVEIDEAIYGTDLWKKEFERYFHKIDNYAEDIAKDLAYHMMQNGDRFIEGYGRVLQDGCRDYAAEDFKDGKMLPADQLPEFAPGLNIVTESTDDFEYEVEEVV